MKYEFDTTVGEGSEVVTVVMEYDTDEEGIYGENIEEIWFEGRNVIGLFYTARIVTGKSRLKAVCVYKSIFLMKQTTQQLLTMTCEVFDEYRRHYSHGTRGKRWWF